MANKLINGNGQLDKVTTAHVPGNKSTVTRSAVDTSNARRTLKGSLVLELDLDYSRLNGQQWSTRTQVNDKQQQVSKSTGNSRLEVTSTGSGAIHTTCPGPLVSAITITVSLA